MLTGEKFIISYLVSRVPRSFEKGGAVGVGLKPGLDIGSWSAGNVGKDGGLVPRRYFCVRELCV